VPVHKQAIVAKTTKNFFIVNLLNKITTEIYTFLLYR
jgi:hypothetical protein